MLELSKALLEVVESGFLIWTCLLSACKELGTSIQSSQLVAWSWRWMRSQTNCFQQLELALETNIDISSYTRTITKILRVGVITFS